MSNAQTSTIDLSSLSFSIDDLADTPEFRIFPAGTHTVQLRLEAKNSKAGQPMIVWKMTAIRSEELADESQKPLADGESNTVYFSLGNKYGAGDLKKAITPIARHFGTSTLLELIGLINGEVQGEECEGMEIQVVTQIKKARASKPDERDSIKIMEVIC
jgi:hypothetical protein